ncbi:hypothetical protein PI125_g11457 [Phytophthora idaei]|nr:hypothetical protein PI125_g11457 [Phytophthora idaei]
MKLANAIATSAVVMVAIASPTSALQGRVERVLILSGEPVPSGTKAYVAGLRIPTACEEAPSSRPLTFSPRRTARSTQLAG